jgi:hypothetical protein
MTMSNTQPDPETTLPLPSYSPEALWQLVLNDLRYQMTKATFNNWLGSSSILTSASSLVFLVVVVRTGFVKAQKGRKDKKRQAIIARNKNTSG